MCYFFTEYVFMCVFLYKELKKVIFLLFFCCNSFLLPLYYKWAREIAQKEIKVMARRKTFYVGTAETTDEVVEKIKELYEKYGKDIDISINRLNLGAYIIDVMK